MRAVVWALFVIPFLFSCAGAEEVDWGAPAPDHEVEQANRFLADRLGQELFDQSIKVVASGLIGTDGEISGYFVCYHFCPHSVLGVYATICVEGGLGKEYTNTNPGEIPNCNENPELCEVVVSIAEALQIARDNGFNAENHDTKIRLRLFPEYSFVWRIDGEIHKSGTCAVGESRGFFLINTRTGAIERRPEE